MRKGEREIVFNKYGGKCAYCGCELAKGWHIDHVLPIKRYISDLGEVNGCKHPERDCIDNMMPSCASCNINKHGDSIENFRSLIQGFMNHLNNLSTQYKIAKRYGLVKEDIKPVVFYFETFK